MKQPFASAVRLRGGGPILDTASKPWLCSGHHHLGSSSLPSTSVKASKAWLFRRLQAGRIATPTNVSPVLTKRHNSISSLRAMATINDFRAP